MTPSALIVHAGHFGKEYRGRPALIDPNFNVYPSRTIGLVGPNGCGKTTLLKTLAGVPAGWNNTTTIGGRTLGVDAKRHVAFPPSTGFPDSQLIPLTVVELYARFFGDFDAGRALSSTRFFDPPLDRKLKEMPEGIGEELQICFTIAQKVCLYLLDEPTPGVDPVARDITLGGILRDFNEDALMFISTHLISDVESILDEVIMLKDGRMHRAALINDLHEECGMSLDVLLRKEYR